MKNLENQLIKIQNKKYHRARCVVMKQKLSAKMICYEIELMRKH